MWDLLSYIRSLYHRTSTVPEPVDISSRKRRLVHDDYDHYSSKLRRLNELKMSSNNCDEWSDLGSTSKTRFSNLVPLRRVPIREPLPVIDLSDDDDLIDVTPRRKTNLTNGCSSGTKPRTTSPEDVFLEARRSMKNCNKVLHGGLHNFNETVRLDEQQLYRDMLMNFPKTSSVYNHEICNTSTPNRAKKFDCNSRTSKIMQMLNGKKRCAAEFTIDLTDDKKINEPIIIKDDSDIESVGSKKKTEQVNSFKKVLDREPYMKSDYLKKFEEMRLQRKLDIEKRIAEERKQRDLFNNTSRENYNTLLEAKIKNCRITDIVLLDEEEEKLSFPEFTPQQESKINEALKCRNPSRVFADKYNLRITGHDLKTFNEKEWLNDEVINFYVNMIQERSQKNKMPKVYAFSTFFYPKLISNGYSSLRRWTKRVDIFSHDIIVVPVHLGFHWCMAIIDFRDKSIRYYDSMLGKNMQCLNALENYLQNEHKDKKKSEYNTSDWRKEIMKDIPRQMNGSDCGVFSCTFAEFITRNAKILFTQEHMPYIRRKMVIEIIEGKLLT